MNHKVTAALALTLLIHAPSILASGQPTPLTPRTLVRTCELDPKPEIIGQQSGDLLAAVVAQDKAPALVYAFQMHGLQPNALNQDGLPALIYLADAWKKEKARKKEIRKYLASSRPILHAETQQCLGCLAVNPHLPYCGKHNAQVNANEQYASELNHNRTYPFSSYLPHLLKISSLTTKAHRNDAYNGKTCQEVLEADPDCLEILKEAHSTHAVAAASHSTAAHSHKRARVESSTSPSNE